MIDMAKKNILPAVTSYVRDLTDTALAKKALSDAIPTSVEEDLITSLSNKLVCFSKKTAELEEAVIKASDYSDDNLKYAKYYRETVFALMQELELSVTQWKQKQLRNTGLILHTANFFSVCD